MRGYSLRIVEAGASVMSLTDTAMVNECLVEFLCQNLSVLVQVQRKLGLVLVFWKDESELEADEAPASLLFRVPG
jgi:hypothetical protein